MKLLINSLFRFFILIFVTPLSWCWDYTYRIRRMFYQYGPFETSHFSMPIISVGNLAFGGTGKTPFTLWLSKYINEHSKEISILMRGYKSDLEHSRGLIKRGNILGKNASTFGDEASMLARRLPFLNIIVGKKRANNLKYYLSELSPDVVLLDDGFQHLSLNRDLNIVLIDASLPLNRYKTAPRGYLREGLSALKDADVMIYTRVDQVEPYKVDRLNKLFRPFLKKNVVTGEIKYSPSGLFDSNYQLIHPINWLKDKEVICIAGIASPESFFQFVGDQEARVVHTFSFPDHHYFSEEEIRPILELSQKENLPILATEKDIVKLRRVIQSESILYIEIEVEFLRGEQLVKEKIVETLA